MWVSPSSTRNHLLNDPIIDWLQRFYNRSIEGNSVKNSIAASSTAISNIAPSSTATSSTAKDFKSYIMRKGVEFEDDIYKILVDRFKTDIIKISSGHYDSTDRKMFQATITAMNNRVPMIYQGVLWDEERKIRGVPDLIVRIDYLERLFGTCKPPDNIDTDRYGILYAIVDIKLSKLSLTCNGINILNSGSIPAYKGQLYLYNYMLGKIQGIEPSTSYILGRGYEYVSKKIVYTGPVFERAGCIDYLGFDSDYVDRAFAAVYWIRRLEQYGSQWSISPPSVPELYPNMCNTMDSEWNAVKKQISVDIGEITSVWYCGVAERQLCHDLGIYSWRDTRLKSSTIGFKNERGRIVDLMLNLNRASSMPKIYIHDNNINQGITTFINDSIPTGNRTNDWKTRAHNDIEMYIDFETINSFIDGSDNYIFMIGLGYNTFVDPLSTMPGMTTDVDRDVSTSIDRDGWIFKPFVMKTLDMNSEEEMIDSFVDWIKSIETLNNKKCRLYHWADAERSQFVSLIKRHDSTRWNMIESRLYDLCKLFKEIPILVKGVFGFGLKEIAKAMYDFKMIDITWNGAITDGMTAMIEAKKAYDECKSFNICFIDTAEYRSINYYNNLDCKIMFVILKYIRSIVMEDIASVVSTGVSESIDVRNRGDSIDADKSIDTAKAYSKRQKTYMSVSKHGYNLRKRKNDDISELDNHSEVYRQSEDIDNHSEVSRQSEDIVVSGLSRRSESRRSEDIYVSDMDASIDEEDVPYSIRLAMDSVKVSLSEILNSRLNDRDLLKAYNLYRDSRDMEKYSQEYIDCMESIKKILATTLYSNLSSIELEKRYMESITDLDKILKSNIPDNIKLSAIAVMRERDSFDTLTTEYIDAETSLSKMLKVDENSVSYLATKIRVSDNPFKDVLYSWYEYIGRDNGDKFKKKIDYALKLPFNYKSSTISVDLKYLVDYKTRLNSYLYGMDNVKARFIQYINLRSKQIIALQGHPGMGKTAICKAHAKAIDKPVYFINVGSCIDIDSLKGSNSVWDGSEPGYISKALVEMQVSDGIIVLDEIDKIDMADNRSRKIYNLLLQILDPTQNSRFEDEYIPGIYMDLSKISFICTFNNIEKIDPILLDRLTVIKCQDYTKEDISIILKQYIIPKIAKEYNLDIAIDITVDAINMMWSNAVSKSMRQYEKYIHSCIAWIKIVYDVFRNLEKSIDDVEIFYDLMGEEYRSYPVFLNGYIIDIDLLNCVIERKNDYHPMYL